MCSIAKNKWRWTFQGLCSLLMFFSIFLSPTTKCVLIPMHIYYLCWTSGSPGFSEVIGLLYRAESTISNTQWISNSTFKHGWYKAFTSDSLHICPLCEYCVHWKLWMAGLGFYAVIKHKGFCFFIVISSNSNSAWILYIYLCSVCTVYIYAVYVLAYISPCH